MKPMGKPCLVWASLGPSKKLLSLSSRVINATPCVVPLAVQPDKDRFKWKINLIGSVIITFCQNALCERERSNTTTQGRSWFNSVRETVQIEPHFVFDFGSGYKSEP